MFDPEKTLLNETVGLKSQAVTISPVNCENWRAKLRAIAELKKMNIHQDWADRHGFSGKPGQKLILECASDGLKAVLYGIDQAGEEGFAPASLYNSLPKAVYELASDFPNQEAMALGWCLEAYEFDEYQSAKACVKAQLLCPNALDYHDIIRQARAVYFCRDLINRPANDLGPQEIENCVLALATQYGACAQLINGAQLRAEFPLIHAVGMASANQPRLVEFSWGNPDNMRLTLIGKGVSFDSGGLDIKSASNMVLMKKDMAGAANVLALAQMIMDAALPISLRVLIPTVENAISGTAFRPGDVWKSRKGLNVEIGNTDAEGRLILADALAWADEVPCDLLITMASLTGAARVALGADLVPFYSTNDAIAAKVQALSFINHDPIWRLPFWAPYNQSFRSNIADLNNSADTGFAGSITAALFLKRFVTSTQNYLHFDLYGWNQTARPGRPKGGEAQGVRTIYTHLKQTVQTKNR